MAALLRISRTDYIAVLFERLHILWHGRDNSLTIVCMLDMAAGIRWCVCLVQTSRVVNHLNGTCERVMEGQSFRMRQSAVRYDAVCAVRVYDYFLNNAPVRY